MSRFYPRFITVAPAIAISIVASAPMVAAQQRTTNDIGRQYASVLAALGEPDLARAAGGRDVYRMLWLRSFHGPVAVRLIRDRDRYSVVTAQAEYGPNYSIGAVRRDSLPLDSSSWRRVSELATIRQFWTLAAPVTLGADGAYWIVEGRRGNQYHAVNWWSPDERDGRTGAAAFRGLALDILDLGKVCVKPGLVY